MSRRYLKYVIKTSYNSAAQVFSGQEGLVLLFKLTPEADF